MTARTSACALALLSSLTALPATGCSEDEPVPASSEELVIGISTTDRPGLTFRDDRDPRSFAGLEIDLGSYVAAGLGWEAGDVSFVPVEADLRESSLASGDVQMVLSAYLESDATKGSVAFTDPYFVAGQDLLVAEDSTTTGPTSLEAQTVCVTQGTPDIERLRAAGLPASALVQEAEDTTECVERLRRGEVDAVTADDVLLAGHAARHPAELRVVGSPFSTQEYRVGLPPDSPDVAAVDTLLARALADGTWQDAVDRYLGASGYSAPLPPTPGGA